MEVKVGTIETLEEQASKPRRNKSFGGGNGGNGGRNRGGGGGGGDRPNGDNHAEEEFKPEKYRVGMWIILVLVFMTFSALISAYMVIAVNRQAEWKPVSLPYQVWISTAILFLSSITLEFARRNLNNSKQIAAKNWLLATTALGAIFVASQLLSWQQLVDNGVYVEGNPYAGFFYIMTATHAIHLIGGIIALGYLLLKSWNITRHPETLFKRQTAGSVVSLYWHAMDGLWIILLALLIFWK